MGYRNFEELTQDVIKNVGLVAGTAVQTYTEPQVEASIQRMFDFLYRKRNWEHLQTYESYTLDGVTGVVTTDLTNLIKSFEDVKGVWVSGTDQRVVRPSGREHLLVAGSTPLYWTPLPWFDTNFTTRVLKFYPIDATGDVDILIRRKPDNFVNQDTVPFPSDVITQAATWDLLDSDGINPTAAAKAKEMFELTYSDLIADLGQTEIGHGQLRNVPLTIRTL